MFCLIYLCFLSHIFHLLYISDTELGDQGVKQIAIVLGSSKSLNTLDVSGK